MAIDPGGRRVGVALSDPTGLVARPLLTLDGGDRDRLVDEIARLAREHEVAELVVGLPRNMDGSEGPMARKARKLAQRLERVAGLPVALEDERLTSVQAGRAIREAGGARGDKGAVDRAAAALLLQGFLDRRAKRADP